MFYLTTHSTNLLEEQRQNGSQLKNIPLVTLSNLF